MRSFCPDDAWDAGNLACGPMLLGLRGRLERLLPGQVFRLVTVDEGAPVDVPAWCRLTGHVLLEASHPTYYLRAERTEPMLAGMFCVSLTHSLDDPDRATVAFVIANAAVASGKETMVFLSTEGVRLAIAGAADAIHEEGFQPLKDLIASFVEAGGTILVCSPCFKKRGLDSGKLIPGAAIVGGARLVEFLSQGAPCVSY